MVDGFLLLQFSILGGRNGGIDIFAKTWGVADVILRDFRHLQWAYIAADLRIARVSRISQGRGYGTVDDQ